MLDQPFRRDMAATVPAPGVAQLFNTFNPATAYVYFLNSAATRFSGDVAQSWLSFIGRRWLMDIRFPEQIAACKTVEDLNVAISEFWQQAYREYSVEFNKIAELTWSAMRKSGDGLTGCASKSADGCCGKCSPKVDRTA